MNISPHAQPLVERLEKRGFSVPCFDGVTLDELKDMRVSSGLTESSNSPSGTLFQHIRDGKCTFVAVLTPSEGQDPTLWVARQERDFYQHSTLALSDYVKGNEKASLLEEIIGPFQNNPLASKPRGFFGNFHPLCISKKTP